MAIENYVQTALKQKASDVHLVYGLPPRARVDGELVDLAPELLDDTTMNAIAEELAGANLPGGPGEVDMAITVGGVRCRINLFKQQGHWSVALRILNDHIPEIEDLGLPAVALELPSYAQGLILITGETGSGKTTTLAAILNRINNTRREHILTLEDPIEYVYKPAGCLINQREIGRDADSFANGLRAALREDPDIILVGEMRDLITIETALTAAETGHLVFGTVHTNSAADSIDRIVDVFPAERQQQIRLQLSMTLKAVLSQQLLPKVGGGRVLACEVMKVDGAIKNLIREGKTPQIINSIQTTQNIGNILMDKALQNLYAAGKISKETLDKALGAQVQVKTPILGRR